jgi:hypothetical protein
LDVALWGWFEGGADMIDGHDSQEAIRRRPSGGALKPDVAAGQCMKMASADDAEGEPAALAELLLGFLPKRKRDVVIGDLYEEFVKDRAKYGLKRARRRYWIETLNSVGPLSFRAAVRLVKRMVAAGVFVWIRSDACLR